MFYLDPHFTRPAIPLEIPPASPGDTARAVPSGTEPAGAEDVPSTPTRAKAEADQVVEDPSTPAASKRPVEDVFGSLELDTPVGPSATAPRSSEPIEVDAQTAWYADAYTPAQLKTFHCDRVKKLPLSGLDPSMLLGFLVRNEQDFDDFCGRAAQVSLGVSLR